MSVSLGEGSMGVSPDTVRGPCVLGLDTGYMRYDVGISCVERPKPGIVVPKLVFYGKVRDEKDVLFLQEQYQVAASMVDCRPDPTVAERYQAESRKRGIKCFRAQYNPGTSDRLYTIDERSGIVTLQRTMAMDRVFKAISEAMGLALPQNFHEICNGSFSAELMGPHREAVTFHGIQTFRWDGPDDDHVFHALTYMLMMMEISGMMFHGSPDILLPQKGIVDGGVQVDEDDESYEDAKFWRRGGVVHES